MSNLVTLGALTVIIIWCGSRTNGERCEYIDKYHSAIYCTSVSGLAELTEQLKRLLKKDLSANLTEINFRSLSDMPCMPSPHLFQHTRIRDLYLSNFTLESWFCTGYRGNRIAFHGLQSLRFSKMKGLEKWNWREVNEYTGKNVDMLSIGSHKGTIRLPSSIQSFYGNHVTGIALAGIENLELEDSSMNCPECDWLHITNTKISNLRKEAFGSGLSKMKYLYLLGNQTWIQAKDILENLNCKNSNSSRIVIGLELHFLKGIDKELIQSLKKSCKEVQIELVKNDRSCKCDCSFGWLLEPGMGVTEVKCKGEDEKEMKLSDFLAQNNCKKVPRTTK